MFIIFVFFKTFSQELIIGSEYIEPGIEIIFEGAIKDIIIPTNTNLNQDQTNVHIEARVNWGNKDIPKGAPKRWFYTLSKDKFYNYKSIKRT